MVVVVAAIIEVIVNSLVYPICCDKYYICIILFDHVIILWNLNIQIEIHFNYIK